MASPITVVELATNKDGKKRSSLPAQEMPVEKKPKTYSITRDGSLAGPRLVIDLISSKGKKDEATRSKPVTLAVSKMASLIANRIAHSRASVVPLVPKPVPRCLLGTKSGSPLERLSTMKSDKVDSAAKVVPRPIPLAAEIGSPTEKEKTVRIGSCEKSTNPVSMESTEIYALLKPDLLEDMDACSKLVDDVKGVVCLSSFAKHTI